MSCGRAEARNTMATENPVRVSTGTKLVGHSGDLLAAPASASPRAQQLPMTETGDERTTAAGLAHADHLQQAAGNTTGKSSVLCDRSSSSGSCGHAASSNKTSNNATNNQNNQQQQLNNNSDNENSTNSTWSNSNQGSRGATAASKRHEATHKLNLILPQNQKGCLTTPVFVTADPAAGATGGNPLFANCTPNPFTQNASGQLFFDPLAHLNQQGEVSLFTGLPTCTPASADLLAASGINPFFWGTSASVTHPAIQSCEQPANATQSEALSLQTRQGNETSNQQQTSANNPQQSQATSNGFSSARSQEGQLNAHHHHHHQQQQQQHHHHQHHQHQQQQHEQQRNKLTIANLQAASALSPLILSPLSLLGLSPEQEAWLRFGYVSPNQHPLAGKALTQADLQQLNQNQHHQQQQLNAMYAQPIVTMHNQYHHHQHQQQQHNHHHHQQQQAQYSQPTRQRTDSSGQQAAAQDLTSTSNNQQSGGVAGLSRPLSQQSNGSQAPLTSPHQQQILYQQQQHQQQQMQQQQQQQQALYSRDMPMQQENVGHQANSNHQQQQQQQQRFFQMRAPQTQNQFGVAKNLVPSFQISNVYQQTAAQPGAGMNGADLHLQQAAQQHKASVVMSTRTGLPAQTHFVHHQGPLRYAPTSSQVNGAPSGMAAATSAGSQVLDGSMQNQQAPNFISNQNVIQASETRPLSSDRCSTPGETLVRQDSLPPMRATGRQQPILSSSSVATSLSQMSEAMRVEKSASSFSSPGSTCAERSQLVMGSAMSQSDSSQHSIQRPQAASVHGDETSAMHEGAAVIQTSVAPSAGQQRLAATKGPSGEQQQQQAGQVTMVRNENGELVPKKKSRGGRKKKLVTHEEMIARKNRSKERNRVAARRCRQKRKQFLDELRDKIDGLNQLNRKLQKENTALKSELDTFKKYHSACSLSL